MSARPYRFHVYQDMLGRWGWLYQAPNGVICMRSEKTYRSESKAVRAARDAWLSLQIADVVCP